MAIFYSTGSGGGGVTSDEVTVTSPQVLTGKTYVGADTNDEKGTGTMPNVPNETNITLTSQDPRKVIVQNTLVDGIWELNNSDGQRRTCIRIPKTGYYNDNSIVATPSSNVAQASGLNASKLANGQSAFGITGTYKGRGNADPSRVLSGSTFSSNNLDNANGTIPIVGGNNITPQTYNQTAISAGQYAEGNIVVLGDSNLIASNIKKGVTLFGITGTAEGFFPTPQDLYLRGNNILGWTAFNNAASFLPDKIRLGRADGTNTPNPSIQPSTDINRQAGMRYLNIECNIFMSNTSETGTKHVTLYKRGIGGTQTVVANNDYDIGWGDIWLTNIQLDISNVGSIANPLLLFYSPTKVEGDIYRIWLS